MTILKTETPKTKGKQGLLQGLTSRDILGVFRPLHPIISSPNIKEAVTLQHLLQHPPRAGENPSMSIRSQTIGRVNGGHQVHPTAFAWSHHLVPPIITEPFKSQLSALRHCQRPQVGPMPTQTFMWHMELIPVSLSLCLVSQDCLNSNSVSTALKAPLDPP